MSKKMRQNAASILALAAAIEPGRTMMFSGRGDEMDLIIPGDNIPDDARTWKDAANRMSTPKPPSGAKTYWFNAAGEFSSVRMLKAETVWWCHAINDKNALRKYNKWKESQKTT